MKLIVGLGNPGRKYDGTRHNVGFRVLGEIARKFDASRPKAAFQGEISEVSLGDERGLLLSPQTFMNKSGGSVLAARDFYKLVDSNLLIVCDDFNLPLGKLRMRSAGSSGGQKGLADILVRLGTEEIPRLRLGVGPVPSGWDGADFVLGRFNKHELPEAEVMIAEAADAVVAWATGPIERCMNRYN